MVVFRQLFRQHIHLSGRIPNLEMDGISQIHQVGSEAGDSLGELVGVQKERDPFGGVLRSGGEGLPVVEEALDLDTDALSGGFLKETFDFHEVVALHFFPCMAGHVVFQATRQKHVLSPQDRLHGHAPGRRRPPDQFQAPSGQLDMPARISRGGGVGDIVANRGKSLLHGEQATRTDGNVR